MMRSILMLLCVLGVGCTGGSAGSAEEVDSDYNLGVDAYLSKDYHVAFEQWTKAAAHGELNALNNLGFLHYNGLGVQKNQAVGVSLWRTASFAGHPESQWHLAAAYESGEGVKMDRTRAYAWYICAVASYNREIEAGEEESHSEALRDARQSASDLASNLTQDELARAQNLAVELKTRYAAAPP
jgi:TPR repeat protein